MNPAPDFDSLRPNIESQRLANFVELEPGQTAVDLGCGGGFIALRLAYRFPQAACVIGVDIQPGAVVRAAAAYQSFLQNDCRFAPMRWLIADAAQPCLLSNSIDAIVTNPPFFAGRSSRPSPDAARRIARRDDALNAEQIVQFADWTLKPAGCLYWVWPALMLDQTTAAAKRFGFTAAVVKIIPEIRKRDGGIALVTLRRSARL